MEGQGLVEIVYKSAHFILINLAMTGMTGVKNYHLSIPTKGLVRLKEQANHFIKQPMDVAFSLEQADSSGSLKEKLIQEERHRNIKFLSKVS